MKTEKEIRRVKEGIEMNLELEVYRHKETGRAFDKGRLDVLKWMIGED